MTIDSTLRQEIDKAVAAKDIRTAGRLLNGYKGQFKEYGFFHIACAEGLIDAVKLFLTLSKLDINMQAGQQKRTALLLASGMGQDEVIGLLIQKGANVNLGDVEDTTPLHFAALHGHVSAARLLIQHGADINKTDNKGYTALIWACADNHEAVVDLLLAQPNIKINHARDNGGTALLVAAANSTPSVLKKLLEKGADLFAQASISNVNAFAWQIAAAEEQKDNLQFLLEEKSKYEKQFKNMTAANRKVLIDIEKENIKENHSNVQAKPTPSHNKKPASDPKSCCIC
jgi:ankyrin repeat protein